MRLPGGDKAVVPVSKLEAYCLNPAHRDGGPKARVFAAALGLTATDIEVLRRALLDAAREQDAEPIGDTSHGTLYRIRFVLNFRSRSAVIRSGWIVREDGVAYLTTAWVEKAR